MNIYADRGNLTVLERRCAWRGIGFELTGAGLGDASTPTRTTSSTSAAARTATRRCARATSPTASATRCTPRPPRRGRVRGVRRLPAARPRLRARRRAAARASASSTSRRVREDGPRLIGNVAIELDLPGGPRVLAGFENHGGRTHLGPGDAPLGRVLRGPRQQRRGRRRGRPRRAARHRRGHLHPRPAAPRTLVRGLADRDARSGSSPVRWRRSTTSSRPPRTRPRAAGRRGV